MAFPIYTPPPPTPPEAPTFESTPYIVVPPGWTQVSEGSFYNGGNSVITMVAAASLNRAATSPSVSQATVGGTNTLLPIIYGTQRVGGRIFAIKVKNGYLTVGVAWCHGEVDSILSTTVNDAALPSGITVTNYTGTSTQTADSELASAFTGYTDTLHGICYSVFEVAPSRNVGFPRFNAVIKGMKISSTSGGAKAYSDNPALIMADFIENTTYGLGGSVDWATVATVAAACDTDLGGGEKKRRLSLVIDQSLPGEAWLQTLRDYAGCFCVPEGGSYRLVADTTGSSVYSFTSANILSGSMRLTKRGNADTPTMVEVTYTDNTVTPYREARYSTAAVSPRRMSRIAKPGITRHSEAVRYAVERLNASTLCDLSATFDTFDEALKLQVGDLIDITHPIGLSAKVMRVMSIDGMTAGRWRINAIEYDAAVYDSSIATAPTTPDTSVDGPTAPPTPTGLVLTEETFPGENGLYISRLKGTWTASTWPYTAGYRVQFLCTIVNPGPDPEYLYIDDFIVSNAATEAYSSAVPVGALARFQIAIRSVVEGIESATFGEAGGVTVSGSGATGVRLTGDFSSATLANRLALQTATTNSSTGVGALPNGTGTSSSYNAFAQADADNASFVQLKVDSSLGYAMVVSSKSGTGTQLPLGFYIGSTKYGSIATTGAWSLDSTLQWKFSSKSGAPTTSDIASGYCGVWKDTGAGTVYLYVNDGGTLKKVQLT
jgi:hypothetical protein